MKISILQIITYMTFVFAFSEFLLMLFKHSKIKTVKTRKDKGSMILLWIMITLGFTGGFFLADHNPWNSMNLFITGIGLLLALAGIIIRWTAIIQLGKSFTVDVAITDAGILKTDGLYKQVRHPSYNGLLLIVIGFSLTMNSLYSLLVLVIQVLIAIIYRINVEEKLLISEFGKRYTLYMMSTKRLIPYIF